MARSGARGLGVATLLLDLGKAFLAVLLARRLVPGDYDVAVLAAVAAILGHMFPVWLRFQGGKGVASGLGVFLALAWPSAVGSPNCFCARLRLYPICFSRIDCGCRGPSDLLASISSFLERRP